MDFDFIIPVSFFFLVGYIVKIVSDNRLKRTLLQKENPDKNVMLVFNKPVDARYTSLKWGMIITAIGLAGVIGFSLPKSIMASYRDEFVFSLFFLFAGAALIVHYVLMIKVNSKE